MRHEPTVDTHRGCRQTRAAGPRDRGQHLLDGSTPQRRVVADRGDRLAGGERVPGREVVGALGGEDHEAALAVAGIACEDARRR